MNVSPASDLTLGLIGLDTSHCIAFTRALNEPSAPNHVPGGRVVAAVKTFSPDMPASVDRVEGYAATMEQELGVRLVPSIEELCAEVDAVLITSLDGRAHLAQARRVFAAQKPVFIDKPLAGSLREVIEIFRLARVAGVAVFSASAYRFYESMAALQRADVGEVRAAISYGPAYLDAHHPDLFFYGIHPAEALFTILGTGCESVVRSHTPDSDVVTGTWTGGRLGVFHGNGALFCFTRFPLATVELFRSPMKAGTGFSEENISDYAKAARQLLASTAEIWPEEPMVLDPLPINGWKSCRFNFFYRVGGSAVRADVTFIDLDEKDQIVVITGGTTNSYASVRSRSDDIIRRWHEVTPEEESGVN